MYKKHPFLFILFMLPILSSAQNDFPGEVPTPQASDLGRYGDVPVSLYTGALSLSIPIHSVTIRGVTLDVTLDYDGSGVRMNSLPGPMGYGWTLRCGGVITRSVNGEYDEFTNGSHYSYYQSYDFIPQAIASQSAEDYLKVASLHGTDLQPDMFYFNFLGMTGRFFLGSDGQWKVLSDHNIEVINDINGFQPDCISEDYDRPIFQNYPGNQSTLAPKTISRFRLRDDRGNIYEFGGVSDAIEYSIGLFGMVENNVYNAFKADAWYLTKVTDMLGNVLYEFEYTHDKYLAQVFHAFESYSIDESFSFGYGGPIHYYAGNCNGDFPWQVTINVPCHLQAVRCLGVDGDESDEGYEITFSTSSLPTPAEQLYQTFYHSRYPVGSLPSQDTFGLPYFYLQTNSTPEKNYQFPCSTKVSRPLDATRPFYYNRIHITDYGRDVRKDVIPTYSFDGRIHMTRLDMYGTDYNPNSGQGNHPEASYRFKYDRYGLLPVDCTTPAIDHWGYYNGNGQSPNYLNSDMYRSQRHPSATCLPYGSLTSVVYPTGGEAVFTYEPHTFSRYVSQDRQSLVDSVNSNGNPNIAGGLRIKSIVLYADTTRTLQLESRTFTYTGEDGKSSGELAGAPIYYWPHWSGVGNGNLDYSLFRGASIVPLANSFGPHVGYTRVVETRADGSQTVTHYSGHADYKDETSYLDYNNGQPSPFDRFGERGYRRGKPVNITRLDNQGNILSTLSYQYGEQTANGTTYGSNLIRIGTGIEGDNFAGGVYAIHAPAHYVRYTSDIIYADGGLATVKTYDYDVLALRMTWPYNHITQDRFLLSETTMRGGDVEETRYRYPVYQGVHQAYVRGYRFHDLTPCAVTRLWNGSEVRTDSTSYRVVIANDSVCYLPSSVMEKHGGMVTDTIMAYDGYTSTGRVRQYHERDKVPVRLYWGLKDNYLLARCVGWGTPANEPILDDSQDIFDRELMLSLFSAFRNANPSFLITSYTWHPLLGVTSITAPDGGVTYYEYDNFHRLEATKDYFRKTITQYDYHYGH